MKNYKHYIFYLLPCLILFLSQPVFSGVTGKIAGRVIDKENQQPLAGTNVFIEGTTLGAAVDLEGYFTILNVPPGVYDIKASMVGYTEVTMKDVRVITDQTATLNFELQIEIMQSETIVVVAERKAVKADVATSVAAFSQGEISTIPISSVEDIVSLQAGVENGFVIRGGSAQGALFQVDGVSMRDPRNNMPISNVAMSSLQEVSIERGGFNAEYGQVRSGIVKIVTKEGAADNYFSNIILKYSPPTRKYYGISPFDPNSTMLRPFLDPEVCWTGTNNGTWDIYTRRQYVDFVGWNEISRRLMTDSDSANDLSPAAAQQLFRWQHRRQESNDQPDYNIDASLGGPVPWLGKKLGNLRFFTSFRTEREMLVVPLSRPDYKDYYWSLKLNSNISPAIQLTISSMIGKSYQVAQNEAGLDNSASYIRSAEQVAAQISNPAVVRATNSRLFCDSYFSSGDVRFQSFAAKMTHVLSSKMFYDLSLEYILRQYHIIPIRERDLTNNIEFIPGYFTNETPFGFSPEDYPGIDGMLTGGHTSTARDFSEISATTLKLDFSSQVDRSNLVKIGFELLYGSLNLEYGDVKQQYPASDIYVKMNKYPMRGSVYFQDKLEFQDLIVNGGVRIDYSNANTIWPDVDTWDKKFYSSNYAEGSSVSTRKAKPETSISPRLSISHPITENSKLFFNYGHFKQLPTYEQLFRLSRGGSNEVQGIGDPNLDLEKTIAYELGYDHALANIYLIQLAAFYRDISSERDYTTYISADGSINYLKATNNLYEDIRGFELTLRKQGGNWWTAFLNYTYQVSTRGHFSRGVIYQDPTAQRIYDQNTRNMYQERPIPQPFTRLNVNFFTPNKSGPLVLGFYPLAEWNLNILTDWRAGPWLTWNPSNQLNISQNVKSKDWFNVELRLMKSFKWDRIQLSVFMDIYNALNIKRLSLNSFYDGFDLQYYFQSLHLPRSNDYDNITGDDKVGDYRKHGVAFQPIEMVGNVYALDEATISNRAIYYDATTGRYMNYINGQWTEVEKKRMQKILDDKAYIDMPNHSYFNFLDMRQIFYGINISFSID